MHARLRHYFAFAIAAVLMLPLTGFAADCADVFPDGLSNSSNSSSADIIFNFGSQLIGSPDNILATTDLNDSSGGGSCNTGNCAQSGSIADTGMFNSFPNNQPDVTVFFGSSLTLSPGNYNNLTVNSSATLNLEPGEYAFRGDVDIQTGVTINITAPGTVRIFVREGVSIGVSSTVNSAGGDRKLFLYAREDISLGVNSTFTGVIYGRLAVTLSTQAAVIGAITSEREITLDILSTVTYQSDAITDTDFGDFCENEPPPLGPDHYSVSAPTNTVACAPFTVTVEAHDSSHTAVDAQSATITLDTATGRGVWSGTGVVDNGDGTASVSFASGATSVSATLLYADLNGSTESITITASDGSVNSVENAAVTVSLAGFQFGTGNFVEGIANQVAGINDSTLRLRAVRTDTNGACVALYPSQTRTVSIAATYRNPTTGAGTAPTLNSQAIVSFANGTAITSYTDLSLTFDADAIAALDFNYNDVGQLQLHARDASGGLETAQGSSGDFVVRPDHFIIAASGNIPAGTDFSVTVTAQRNGGGVTANYGNENSPEGVAVSFNTLVLPVGGSNGALTTSTPFTGSNGVFSGILNWSEVGTMTLIADVAGNDYLGTGGGAANPIPSGDIGRFYPADFVFGSDSAQNSCGSFSYLSHPAIAVAYTLTARNANGVTTINYDADSDSISATANYPVRNITHRAMQGVTDLTSRLVMTSANWDDGVYAVNTTDTAINRSSTVESPFSSVQLSASIDTGPDPITLPADTDIGSPLDLRFGRAVIRSVHGPESAFLAVPFGTEYWNGNQFVTASGDSCTTIATDQIQFDGTAVSTSPETVNFGGGATDGSFFFTAPNATATGGTFGLAFSPPGAGNTGSFPVNVSLSNYPLAAL